MNIEDIFTNQELALIDSGNYKPGRAVLDAKLDLVAAIEREACAKVCESHKSENFPMIHNNAVAGCVFAIRARGQT